MISRVFRRVAILSVCLLLVLVLVIRLASGGSNTLEQVLKDVPRLYNKNIAAGKAVVEGTDTEGGYAVGNAAKEGQVTTGRDGLAVLSFPHKKGNEQLELARKMNDLTQKLVNDQEKRINRLEAERINLEKQLQDLRRPSDSLSLREKLAFLYPYDTNRRFPGYVWQSWKYGLNDERFGREFKLGEEKWAKRNPGFVHEIFNDDTSNAFVHYLFLNIPEVIEAYDALPNIVLKMDFFRYLILFARGGIWADIDTYPVRPVPNWIPDNVEPSELGMIIGVDVDTQGEGRDEWRSKRARKFQFSNSVIQAKPGHPILRDIIAEITESTIQRKRAGNIKLPVSDREIALMNWTGEGLWTDVILKFFNDYVLSGVFTKVTWRDFHELDVPKLVSDVLVMPKKSFASPLIPSSDGSHDKDNDDDTDPLVMVRHQHSQVYKEVW
ncbi:DEKNAAC105278 [Brettanomyces naardenensis]|uniref:DEKNAAC105278 n=1 Tax=Brettanomyces naardenensis TaxID=13370 RepID=A0A448YSZ5_BRENA|nr:DEKNAAC105278 [Brettanomyces naardenensis]